MRIILIGYGVVGQSLTHVLIRRRTEIENHFFKPKVVAIVDTSGAAINLKGLDLERTMALKKQNGRVAADPEFGHSGMSAADVIKSIEAEVIVDMTPSNAKNGEPALSHIMMAFKKGIHVVTTSKGPLALMLPVLAELASHNKVCLRFSGTVGGGLPVLDFAKKGLLGDRVVTIRGILNGTTNYILTEMADNRTNFSQALENAQELGYAETDPSMDVNGIDTACKLVIMANWIMNKKCTLKDVKIQGIRNMHLETLDAAAGRENAIKLVGSIGERLKVEPTEIPKHDPLCVNGVLNAVTFVSEFAGEATIIGRGAGGVETASAVLRDLLDIRQNLANRLLT